jgi:hypothetical protein
VKTELKLPAMPALPTSDETEQIAMSGDVERLRAILRRARAADPGVRVFDVASLTLYSFRFLRGRADSVRALAFSELAVEANPRSVLALNNLGNTYRDIGQMPRAIEQWERALTMIDSDPDLPPADRAQSRAVIEQKLRQARPRP